MPQKPKQEYLTKIRELHTLGYTDSDIASELNIRSNLVNHYRHKLMQLPANWLKREYQTNEDRLKGYILRGIKSSAKRRQIVFDLDYTDLILPKTCPIFGFELVYRELNTTNAFNSDAFATVDRIDNTLGYVKGNVWIISRLANTMKSYATLDQLQKFCTNITTAIETHRALGNITDSVSLDS